MASWQEILGSIAEQSATNKLYDSGDPKLTFNALHDARDNPQAVAQHGGRNLANAEHEAFAYGVTRDNPLMAAPLMLAIPAYDAAKRVGLMTDDNTSAPGIDQMSAGYQGMWRGLKDATWEQILGVDDAL